MYTMKRTETFMIFMFYKNIYLLVICQNVKLKTISCILLC